MLSVGGAVNNMNSMASMRQTPFIAELFSNAVYLRKLAILTERSEWEGTDET